MECHVFICCTDLSNLGFEQYTATAKSKTIIIKFKLVHLFFDKTVFSKLYQIINRAFLNYTILTG